VLNKHSVFVLFVLYPLVFLSKGEWPSGRDSVHKKHLVWSSYVRSKIS